MSEFVCSCFGAVVYHACGLHSWAALGLYNSVSVMFHLPMYASVRLCLSLPDCLCECVCVSLPLCLSLSECMCSSLQACWRFGGVRCLRCGRPLVRIHYPVRRYLGQVLHSKLPV